MSATDILRDLQDRVTALEQQLGDQPGPDSLTPNVITYDGGTVGAKFTGLINALGVILPSAPGSSLTLPNAVEWQRAADAALAAWVQGDWGPGLPTGMSVQAHNPDHGSFVRLRLTGNSSVPTANKAAVGTANYSVQLIDDADQSSFVKNVNDAPANMQIAGGRVSTTWPGASNFSNTTTITGTPFATFGGCIISPNVATPALYIPTFATAYVAGTNPAQWAITAYDPTGQPAAGTAAVAYYLAFGF